MGSKKDSSDTKGFEELIDIYRGVSQKKTKATKKLNDDFELLNYFEKEDQRITKLLDFFQSTWKNYQNHSQLDSLMNRQEEELEEQRDLLISKISKSDSYFMEFLSKIFTTAYSEHSE